MFIMFIGRVFEIQSNIYIELQAKEASKINYLYIQELYF